MMTASRPTPPHSRDSSTSSNKRQRTSLALDLTDLPPLITPAPPSNTLLVTNLNDPEIFAQETLSQVRRLIDERTENAVYTFSPLRSMRRIIITFHSIEAATAIRSLLDGETLFKSRIRIYFGEPTPVTDLDNSDERRLLKAPQADKQFFISPPPSPPMGWEMRQEDPPNKEVHAEDLAVALERLNAKGAPSPEVLEAGKTASTNTLSSTTASHTSDDHPIRMAAANTRKRSGSVIVYDPVEDGKSPDLPAIAVEDTSGEGEMIADDGLNAVSHTTMPRTEMPPTDVTV